MGHSACCLSAGSFLAQLWAGLAPPSTARPTEEAQESGGPRSARCLQVSSYSLFRLQPHPLLRNPSPTFSIRARSPPTVGSTVVSSTPLPDCPPITVPQPQVRGCVLSAGGQLCTDGHALLSCCGTWIAQPATGPLPLTPCPHPGQCDVQGLWQGVGSMCPPCESGLAYDLLWPVACFGHDVVQVSSPSLLSLRAYLYPRTSLGQPARELETPWNRA